MMLRGEDAMSSPDHLELGFEVDLQGAVEIGWVHFRRLTDPMRIPRSPISRHSSVIRPIPMSAERRRRHARLDGNSENAPVIDELADGIHA